MKYPSPGPATLQRPPFPNDHFVALTTMIMGFIMAFRHAKEISSATGGQDSISPNQTGYVSKITIYHCVSSGVRVGY